MEAAGGLVQAATLEFEAAAAGAIVVSAGFWLLAAVGGGRCLCTFVHWFRGGTGIAVDARGRLGRGRGGGLEDGERGAEADGGRSFGIVEDCRDGRDGGGGESFGMLAMEECAIVKGMRERVAEGWVGAAPIVNGVAVNVELPGGFRSGVSAGDGGDGTLLRVGEPACQGLVGDGECWCRHKSSIPI